MVRIPRPRFSVRWMMVAVAVFAMVSLVGRQSWEGWLRRGYRTQARGSQLTFGPFDPFPQTLIPGRPVPISITYDVRFSRATPAPGSACLVLARVWLEDQKTGRYVDGYSFDVRLKAGERTTAAGTFTWDAEVPGPGRYQLNYLVEEVTPWGEFQFLSGGDVTCDFLRAPTTNQPGAPP